MNAERAPQKRFRGFSCASGMEFYVPRDAIALAIAEVGIDESGALLRDLEALLRAALAISLVNELPVFDWLGWGELWKSRLPSVRETPGDDDRITFDLFSYGPQAYQRALVAATTLPQFWQEARAVLDASGVSGGEVERILSERHGFIERNGLAPTCSESPPAPDLGTRRTQPPAPNEVDVLDRLIRELSASTDMSLVVEPGTPEFDHLAADAFVAKSGLLRRRSDDRYRLNTASLFKLALRPPQSLVAEYDHSQFAKAARRIARGHDR